MKSVRTHELTSISPLNYWKGEVYWVVNMYWNTTVPEFKEFQDWCKERNISIEIPYKVSRIPTWDLMVLGVRDEQSALEFKIRWS